MSPENIDLGEVIALLEAKRAALDSAIAALRVVHSTGAVGPTPDGITPTVVSPMSASGSFQGAEVPDGAFHGRSVPAAIKLFLGIVRKKQTAREISDGLRKGGIESTSKWFDKIIYATLDRMRKSGDILKLESHWALPEWYPPSVRAGLAESGQAEKKVRKGARRTKKSRLISEVEPVPYEVKPVGLQARIDAFLRESPDQHSAEDVSKALQIPNVKTAHLMLGQLVSKGKAKKTEDGKYYRLAS